MTSLCFVHWWESPSILPTGGLVASLGPCWEYMMRGQCVASWVSLVEFPFLCLPDLGCEALCGAVRRSRLSSV
jgi:hypothetical protein